MLLTAEELCATDITGALELASVYEDCRVLLTQSVLCFLWLLRRRTRGGAGGPMHAAVEALAHSSNNMFG